jgi:hypothetical protein
MRNREPDTAKLEKKDISTEAWREYDFVFNDSECRIYRIDNPVDLYIRSGGTTHRVVDSKGVTHCVPAPGQFGCILRWQGKDGGPDVSF